MMISGRDYLKVPSAISPAAFRAISISVTVVSRAAPYKMILCRSRLLPFKSHDMWFLTEEQRWGKLPMNLNKGAAIAKVNRADIWRAAAAKVGGVPVPPSDSRGVEKFFDGKTFDPGHPEAYLKSLAIKRV
jgi:nitrate/nitrite transport system substrate-binding protein